jgi:hypothetical protein
MLSTFILQNDPRLVFAPPFHYKIGKMLDTKHEEKRKPRSAGVYMYIQLHAVSQLAHINTAMIPATPRAAIALAPFATAAFVVTVAGLAEVLEGRVLDDNVGFQLECSVVTLDVGLGMPDVAVP